jgi:hypothetical protein
MPAVSNALFAVTFDCADAAALARLWADVLGRLRDVKRGEIRWTTFADIEDNEFDLIAG